MATPKITYWDLDPELRDQLRGLLKPIPYDDTELRNRLQTCYDDWPEVQKRKFYKEFVGATTTSDGDFGLIPPPKKGEQSYLFFGDGTWRGQETLVVGRADGDENGVPIQSYFIDASYNFKTFELTLTRGDLTTLVLYLGDLFTKYGSEDMPGEFIVRRSGYADMPGEFTISRWDEADMPGSFTIKINDGEADMPGSFIIKAKDKYADMPGEFEIKLRDSEADMPGSFTIKVNEGSTDMPGSLEVKKLIDGVYSDMPGSFIINFKENYKDMPGTFIVQMKDAYKDMPGSMYVKGILIDGNKDMPGSFTVKLKNACTDMPGSMFVRGIPKDGSRDMTGTFTVVPIKAYKDMPGRFTVKPTIKNGYKDMTGSFTVSYPHYVPDALILTDYYSSNKSEDGKVCDRTNFNPYYYKMMQHVYVRNESQARYPAEQYWHGMLVPNVSRKIYWEEPWTSIPNKLYINYLTTMEDMFKECRYIEELDLLSLDCLGIWDTRKITSMAGMFGYCESLRSIDISMFNLGNVTSMENIFQCCYALESIKLPKFDGNHNIDLSGAFNQCKSLKSIDISKFSTAGSTDMNSMFARMTSLEEIKGEIDCASITNFSALSGMFIQTYNVKKITFINMPYDNVNHFDGERLRENLGLYTHAPNTTIEVRYRDGKVKYW